MTHLKPKTEEEILALLQERPDDAELYQQLGMLYQEQREIMKAWRAYMQSLRLNPHDPFTCLYFGNLLTICDDKKYALLLFKYAIQLAPDLAVAHWCLADLYCKLGDYGLAERSYERAVEVAPDHEQARSKLTAWRTFVEENAMNRLLWAEAKSVAEVEELGGEVVMKSPESTVSGVMLRCTNVTDAGLEHVKVFKGLQSLDLESTNVTDAGLEHLSGLTNLQSLDLEGTNVTDVGLEHLKGLANLQSLDLWGTKVTDAGVKTLQQVLPNCKIER